MSFFLKESFRYFNKDANEFFICQCANSAAVNIKVSKIMNIPHVSYKSHNLSLQCNEMIDSNEKIKKATASVCSLDASIHGSEKVSTDLQNDVAKANRYSVRAKAWSVTL